MASTMGCLTCGENSRLDSLPPRGRIVADEHWRVAHAADTALPGWLVLTPRRHVASVADLAPGEASALGGWQSRLSRALREVTGCAATYVAHFAERPGYTHLRFHIVPVADDMPDRHRGPSIFTLLGAVPAERVTDQRMDDVALALRAALR